MLCAADPAHFDAGLTRVKGWCTHSVPLSRRIRLESLLGRPLEVEVRDSLEKAMKILKQKMSKEGILQEVKRRRFYEKPSVKRKRKMREARKRRRREAKRRVAPKP
jgi:small subunit ribosomal protein S21